MKPVLPAVGAVLIAGVLGVQISNGGGDFVPAGVRDPCIARSVTTNSDGLEGLSEGLILVGLDKAACSLGVSREVLVLDLADSGTPTDRQVTALHDGLLAAVTQLSDAGQLPKASKLADQAIAASDLSWFVKQGFRLLPDSAINGLLKTDDVLRRTVNDLDLRQLLENVKDADSLNKQLKSAVTDAVKDSVIARLKDLLPG